MTGIEDELRHNLRALDSNLGEALRRVNDMAVDYERLQRRNAELEDLNERLKQTLADVLSYYPDEAPVTHRDNAYDLLS